MKIFLDCTICTTVSAIPFCSLIMLKLLLQVAKALVETFAEMIFVHGYIHGDPHPGNILVSPDNCSGLSLGMFLSWI